MIQNVNFNFGNPPTYEIDDKTALVNTPFTEYGTSQPTAPVDNFRGGAWGNTSSTRDTTSKRSVSIYPWLDKSEPNCEVCLQCAVSDCNCKELEEIEKTTIATMKKVPLTYEARLKQLKLKMKDATDALTKKKKKTKETGM